VIGSIRKAWQSAYRGEGRLFDPSDAALRCMTRASFLRVMAAGTLAAGVGGAARATVAAPSRRVAPVTDIDKLYDAWQVRFNMGDLEGLVDLYFDDVTYVNPDGKLMIGKARVHEDFVELLALKPQIVLGDRRHVLYQDIALTTNHWRMNFDSPDGVKQELTGGGIEVMRKQADGGWRYIIDDASRSASK